MDMRQFSFHDTAFLLALQFFLYQLFCNFKLILYFCSQEKNVMRWRLSLQTLK